MDKMGEKSIDNLIDSIEKSKSVGYTKALYSLGILNVGKYLAGILAKESKSIERLAEMTKEDFLNIDGIGDIVANSVVELFGHNL